METSRVDDDRHLLRFVPLVLLSHLKSAHLASDEPASTAAARPYTLPSARFHAAAVYADFSGVHELTEAFPLDHDSASLINLKYVVTIAVASFLERINRLVGVHGGDLLRLTADSVLAVWRFNPADAAGARSAALSACRCANDLSRVSGETLVDEAGSSKTVGTHRGEDVHPTLQQAAIGTAVPDVSLAGEDSALKFIAKARQRGDGVREMRVRVRAWKKRALRDKHCENLRAANIASGALDSLNQGSLCTIAFPPGDARTAMVDQPPPSSSLVKDPWALLLNAVNASLHPEQMWRRVRSARVSVTAGATVGSLVFTQLGGIARPGACAENGGRPKPAEYTASGEAIEKLVHTVQLYGEGGDVFVAEDVSLMLAGAIRVASLEVAPLETTSQRGLRVLLLRGFSPDAPETSAREAEAMAMQTAGGLIRSGAPLRALLSPFLPPVERERLADDKAAGCGVGELVMRTGAVLVVQLRGVAPATWCSIWRHLSDCLESEDGAIHGLTQLASGGTCVASFGLLPSHGQESTPALSSRRALEAATRVRAVLSGCNVDCQIGIACGTSCVGWLAPLVNDDRERRRSSTKSVVRIGQRRVASAAENLVNCSCPGCLKTNSTFGLSGRAYAILSGIPVVLATKLAHSTSRRGALLVDAPTFRYTQDHFPFEAVRAVERRGGWGSFEAGISYRSVLVYQLSGKSTPVYASRPKEQDGAPLHDGALLSLWASREAEVRAAFFELCGPGEATMSAGRLAKLMREWHYGAERRSALLRAARGEGDLVTWESLSSAVLAMSAERRSVSMGARADIAADVAGSFCSAISRALIAHAHRQTMERLMQGTPFSSEGAAAIEARGTDDEGGAGDDALESELADEVQQPRSQMEMLDSVMAEATSTLHMYDEWKKRAPPRSTSRPLSARGSPANTVASPRSGSASPRARPLPDNHLARLRLGRCRGTAVSTGASLPGSPRGVAACTTCAPARGELELILSRSVAETLSTM